MATIQHPIQAVRLAHQAMHEIPDAAGIEIACTAGSLWLTLDNDPRDVILEPGEVFFTTEHRRAIVYALKSGSVTLRPAQVPQPARARAMPTWRERLALGH